FLRLLLLQRNLQQTHLRIARIAPLSEPVDRRQAAKYRCSAGCSRQQTGQCLTLSPFEGRCSYFVLTCRFVNPGRENAVPQLIQIEALPRFGANIQNEYQCLSAMPIDMPPVRFVSAEPG